MGISSEFFELSQPQKSIWYLEQKYPRTCMNNIAGTLRFKGQTDYCALEKAINLMIKNNDAMRLHFCEKNGEAKQYLTPYIEKKLDFFDFSQGNSFDDLFGWDDEQTKIPFEIYDSDLHYFAIIKIDENNGGLYSKMHHLVSDAWTMSILGNEIVGYYSAIKNGTLFTDQKKPSFLEHLDNENKYELSDRYARDKEYWNEKFDAYPEPTVLKPQALSCTDTSAKRKTFITPQKLSDKIRAYCTVNNVSVFTLFLSALSIYINRVTGNKDIILGTTILNRINSREKDTAGMFVSVAAPIRIQMSGSQNFTEFSAGMLKENISILKHQKYPYNYLVRDLKKKHKLSSRLFDIVLNYQNSKFSTKQSAEEYLTRWHFSGHQVESLVIHVNDRDDGGNYIIDYDFLKEVYNAKEIEFLHQHVSSLLWHALDNPLRPISRIEMLSEKEKHQILYDFNNTAADFPRDRTLHEFLYIQAEKTPDKIAVIFRDRHMTYREVNEKSNQLARRLQQKGVGPETIVGISVFRSFEMIIGLMGILKAGGAYLPIDPDYPRDRVQYMMNDSGAQILLTQKALADRFTFDTDIVSIDDHNIYFGDSSDLAPGSGPSNLAYIIYTSGSTGKPKGVMIEHRSIVNRIHWMQKKYPLDAESTILQKTPFTFDVSVWELFWWTFSGARLSVLEPGGEKDPRIIISEIVQNSVTAIHFVPSMLGAFLEYVSIKSCSSKLSTLQQVFSSGEALTTAQVDTFNRVLFLHNKTRLYNLYGPTEAAVDVSFFHCSPKLTLKTVPIGKPIDNIRLYIFDNNKMLLPIGIPGELYIGGEGVGRGYINNPYLTAERFVEDPYSPGNTLYRTGDRARWFPKGDIEYLGRLDFQVKIRGVRIELGEIESRLLSYSRVKSAVVAGKVSNGNSELIAYYSADKEIKTSDLKNHLSRELPEYMIPTFFVFLSKIPLSSNGKVDRKALPIPEIANKLADEYFAPTTETQKALALIWTNLLEMQQIGITEDFFEIGGDSLRAITLSGEIHRNFRVELTIKDIFTSRTIKKMSELIDEASIISYSSIPIIPQSNYYKASSAQKRLYVLRQLEEGINYNLPGVMRIEGKLEPDKIVRTMEEIIKRHESLRTSFDLIDGEPVQRIHGHVNFEVTCTESDIKDVQIIIDQFVRPFDLGSAPLLRAVLVRIDSGTHLLLFDMHHIITDGESINILIREFSDLYASKKLSEMKTQYKDYAAWQNGLIDSGKLQTQEKYWLSKFSDELPILNIPTDFSRPTKGSSSGDKVSFELDEEVTTALKCFAAKTQTTVFMILLAAYNVLLSRYSGQEDIIVGTPVSGRQHPDLKDIIGVFVNTLAIRNYPVWEKSFFQFLQEVKDNLIESYENQEYPIELLVEKVCTKRDTSRKPLFDVAFVYQNMNISSIHADGLAFSADEINTRSSKFDITFEACDKGETIRINAEYRTDLFLKDTIDRLLCHFSNILQEVMANNEIKISEIKMLSEAEKQQLVFEFNDTSAEYPKNMTINQIFEEQADKTPGNTAIVFEDYKITYRELNERSNCIARMLLEKGILPDEIVAVSVSPSIEMIVGILGVLKAGAAYLPLDPDYPDERICYMMEDSKAKIMLAQKAHQDRYTAKFDCIFLDEKDHYLGDSSNPAQVHRPDNLAYVMYTSGSTGEPKGVMIEHRNVVRLLFNSKFQFEFSEKDVWTLFHSFCFDFSVWEMYGALLYGGRLVIIEKQKAKDTRQFLDILKKERVTVLNQTPAAFNSLITEEMAKEERSLCLNYVIFGGDALKPVQLQPFHHRYPKTKLINMYGITETTVHVTYKEIGEADISNNISNVGRAIPTLNTYIVDRKMNLVPIGVPGELCVSGAGVGRGYLNNCELTCQKFCSNPFIDNEKMYRSGDLAKISACGDIEYLGRIDSQIKIRGYRIELGEIESVLLKHPLISEVFAIARKNQYDDNQLFVYFVGEEALAYDDLKAYMERSLPQYMIPAFFIQMEKMPINKNGKIDRTALPGSEEATKKGNSFVAAESMTEKMLADIWTEVLGLENIGIDDDFFDVGGESLSAIKAISKIPPKYSNITLVALYNNPTIRQLAIRLDENTKEEESSILVRLSPRTHNKRIPVICFPYGGGNAISYRNMSDSAAGLLSDFALYAVNLPGHDLGEENTFLSVEETSLIVLEAILALNVGEIVLYGHCVGSAALIETARLLEKEKICIKSIFIGGILPPKFVGLYGGVFDPWRLYSDKKIMEYLCSIGLPYSSADVSSMGFIIKAFRHDTRSFYQYLRNYSIEKYAKLKSSIHLIVGEKDKVTKNYPQKNRDWLRYFNSVVLHVIPDAEHYFINSHSLELIEIMREQMEKSPIPDK